MFGIGWLEVILVAVILFCAVVIVVMSFDFLINRAIRKWRGK